jgi:hypothetical protein
MKIHHKILNISIWADHTPKVNLFAYLQVPQGRKEDEETNEKRKTRGKYGKDAKTQKK